MKPSILHSSLIAFGTTLVLGSCATSGNRHLSDYVVNTKIERHILATPDTTYLTQLYRHADKFNNSYLEVARFKDKEGEKLVISSGLLFGNHFESLSKVHYTVVTFEKAKQVHDYLQSLEDWEQFSDKFDKLPSREINYQVEKDFLISATISYQFNKAADKDGAQKERANAFIDELDIFIDGRRHRVNIDKFKNSLKGIGEVK